MKSKDKAEKYWDKSAKRYSDGIKHELIDRERQIWTDLILENAPEKECLRVLDIGTGPGFFSIILSKCGHQVTGIDCTPAMLEEARQNAVQEGVEPEFLEMDVHNLAFPDNTFDLVVSRNVSWTLYDPMKAYTEWKRVLKPGGRIIIFDANWYMNFFHEPAKQTMMAGIRTYRERYGTLPPGFSMFLVEDYWRQLPQVGTMRPLWDQAAFWRLGLQDITIEEDITPKTSVSDRNKLLYGATPMFMIRGTKVTAEEELKSEIRDHWDGRSIPLGVNAVESVKNGNAFYKDWLKAALLKTGSILDVGCGAGELSALLAKDGYEVTGLDFSERMLEESAYTAKQADVRINLVKGDAEQLPFEDASFDMILVKDLLWQSLKPEKILEECIRVLKSGGILFIADADHYSHMQDEESRNSYKKRWSPVAEQTLHLVYGVDSGRSSMIDRIADAFPLTGVQQPQWEQDALEKRGMKLCFTHAIPETETEIPSFLLAAEKE